MKKLQTHYVLSVINIILIFICGTSFATNRHVVAAGTIANGLDVPPYNTWTNAATNIQWAVDAATNTETVWVSNGPYVLTDQILITNAISLRGTNGRDLTIINGNYPAYINRCLLISNSAAFVSGFTFSNGAISGPSGLSSRGGGVCMYGGVLSNCTVRNNWALTNDGGGGIYMKDATAIACRVTDNIASNLNVTMYGGGVYGGAIIDCFISNNLVRASPSSSSFGANGGGAYYPALVRSSMICNNRVSAAADYGGGVFLSSGSVLDSSTVTVNQAASAYGAAGVHFAGSGATVTNCMISHNNGPNGAIWLSGAATTGHRLLNSTIYGNANYGIWEQNITDFSIYNCVVRSNSVGIYLQNSCLKLYNSIIANNTNGGLRIGANSKTCLVSCCTFTSNQSASAGAGIRFESTNPAMSVSSCIIYSNGIGGTNDVYDACAPTNYNALQYSCVGTNTGPFMGAGIIVTDPKFKNFAGGDYRLAANSPCINTGSNEDWMTNSVDLNGRRRIRYGMVDMGAYERIHDGSMYGLR